MIVNYRACSPYLQRLRSSQCGLIPGLVGLTCEFCSTSAPLSPILFFERAAEARPSDVKIAIRVTEI